MESFLEQPAVKNLRMKITCGDDLNTKSFDPYILFEAKASVFAKARFNQISQAAISNGLNSSGILDFQFQEGKTVFKCHSLKISGPYKKLTAFLEKNNFKTQITDIDALAQMHQATWDKDSESYYEVKQTFKSGSNFL